MNILIAGCGNIFLGDDGFGVAVAQSLAKIEFNPSVKVVDFGIRSRDLAFELLRDYAFVIIVDALARGQVPGTVYQFVPELEDICQDAMHETHETNVLQALRLATRMGAKPTQLLLVGCEPLSLAPATGDGNVCLSEPVARAVPEAVQVIEQIVRDFQANQVRS